ncbi:dihydrodipicolinate synthase family protein [Azospirillum sp. ST 5-10]|uniref:dihydrodipicolinate synthase family protein n=1 Tax=unclassified Azospirillum TaxID=2630922 RepID=UPI003F4A6136
MATRPIRGIIPPVPTIVDDQGRLDRPGMAALIDRVVASGVDGMLILGSGGEFCHMPAALRKEVAEFAVSHTAGRLPILLGIGAPGTGEVVDFGRHAQSLGVAGVLVVNPFYAKLSRDGLFRHYATVAEALDVPVFLYNFPALTGQELEVGLVRDLALAFDTIAGIKDTVDTLGHTRQVILDVKARRPDFLVYSGYDEYLLDVLVLGGDGGIPASANFAPEIACGLYRAFQERDLERIVALQRRLATLSALYTLDTPFFGLVKEAIRLTGSAVSTAVLPPALVPSAETKAELVAVLQRAGVAVTA